ncbi:armadillo-like helical domain containing protein 1 [Leucoraja erinacea]|uniref:armadillo-like helical domain containing protein 1 n=1 Tax=Leucoraja erinaceus TaxID=7782 RepID=UPI0024555342|nr:armadillo-like helical domain containing protein 1 [Leucoraja erinacea]XP_055497707.1 armadillo-like helical domain containing protein 1 [Leucoraja erinacea]
MTLSTEQIEISKFMSFLQDWDRGTKAIRHQILNDFINTSKGKTSPELELQFAQGASLFLTRLTAWLRITYMVGTCVTEQLQAIGIFLTAASGHRYLVEILEVGGILTLLEILRLKQLQEDAKQEALKLLTIIANAGRKYKELICESYGVRNIAECLANSKLEKTQEQAQILLELLAQGNPKYQLQVYKGLIALLPCTSPKVQQMALQALRTLQSIVKIVHPCIVDPLLNILRTIHYEVQYEVIEFIKVLLNYKVRQALLEGLVARLTPSTENQPKILHDEPTSNLAESSPLYVQQAAAAKVIGIIIKDSTEIAEEMLQLRVVHNLMIVMGNLEYASSQKQACLTLEYLIHTFPVVEEHVRHAIGESFYELYMRNPENLYLKMDSIQAGVLVNNKVNIPGSIEAAAE